jgi:hypothetical protein
MLICQVQSLAHVRAAVDVGADIIVAQGAEAGGHSGERTTFTLVPEMADLLANVAPETLLVAAGGVGDGWWSAPIMTQSSSRWNLVAPSADHLPVPGAGERVSKPGVRTGDIANSPARLAQLQEKAQAPTGQVLPLIVIQRELERILDPSRPSDRRDRKFRDQVGTRP